MAKELDYDIDREPIPSDQYAVDSNIDVGLGDTYPAKPGVSLPPAKRTAKNSASFKKELVKALADYRAQVEGEGD